MHKYLLRNEYILEWLEQAWSYVISEIVFNSYRGADFVY